MCGIVGLLIKNPALKQHLGEMMVPMLVEMGARGPDSAGLAVFTEKLGAGQRKYSLYAPSWDYDWAPVESDFVGRFGDEATLFRLASQLETARPWFNRRPPVSA